VDISEYASTDTLDFGPSIENILTIYFLAQYRLPMRSIKPLEAQTIKLVTIKHQAKSSTSEIIEVAGSSQPTINTRV